MDALTHLNESRNLMELAADLFNRGRYLAAGELLWGAIVHAVSAADPDHEIQPPDRFNNVHRAPNTNTAFADAVRRISGRPLSESQISFCLNNGQQRLHNHFYHLNLTPRELQHSISVGAFYAQLLMRVAARAVSQ